MNNKPTKKLTPYLHLMRVDRPIGTLLLLWPTWWALWLAEEKSPKLSIFIIFTIGVILMRAAGCVINDIFDRKFDGNVRRTAARPLAQGTVSVQQAWLLFLVLLLLAAGLLFFLQKLTIYLACGAAFVAVTYPLMKRITNLPQIYLGIAFSFSIPMAFAEITGSVPKTAWLLFIANILWTTAYDTIYAMVDRKDDLRIGIKSTAILFGDLDTVMIGIFQIMTLLALTFLGQQQELNWYYYIGLAVAALLFAQQQLMIKDRQEQKCFQAFLQNNRIGIVIFLGILAATYLK